MSRLSRHAFVALLLSFIIIASQAVQANATQYEQFNLDIVTTNCLQMPTSFPFQGGDCVPATGAVIVVTSTDGSLIGTCIAEMGAPDSVIAGCSVSVPFGTEVVVTEDPATITTGFAPTNNPQTFEVPASPPDGSFGGPVFINLPASGFSPVLDETRTDTSDVALVGKPDWWIVPRAPGWGNTDDGTLYFGALVSNPTERIVKVGVSWRAYEADGTPFSGCQLPGGDGPGVTTTIAPGETAYLRCFRILVPNALQGLQVTSQLWIEDSFQTRPADFEIIESSLEILTDLSSPMDTTYDVNVLVSVPAESDVETTLIFRFYTADGIQVGTCESGRLVIEPDVNQRINCAFPLLLDSQGLQPTTVRAEPAPSPINY